MLRSLKEVATFLAKAKLPNIVLDPILKSSSGADLLDKPGRAVLVEKLFPLAPVITQNAAEALGPDRPTRHHARANGGRGRETPHDGSQSRGRHRRRLGESHRRSKLSREKRIRARGLQSRAAEVEIYSRNRVRILHRHRLPPSPKAQSAGSSLVSQGIRQRSHRQWRSHGQGHRPGQSLVSDE